MPARPLTRARLQALDARDAAAALSDGIDAAMPRRAQTGPQHQTRQQRQRRRAAALHIPKRTSATNATKARRTGPAPSSADAVRKPAASSHKTKPAAQNATAAAPPVRFAPVIEPMRISMRWISLPEATQNVHDHSVTEAQSHNVAAVQRFLAARRIVQPSAAAAVAEAQKQFATARQQARILAGTATAATTALRKAMSLSDPSLPHMSEQQALCLVAAVASAMPSSDAARMWDNLAVALADTVQGDHRTVCIGGCVARVLDVLAITPLHRLDTQLASAIVSPAMLAHLEHEVRGLAQAQYERASQRNAISRADIWAAKGELRRAAWSELVATRGLQERVVAAVTTRTYQWLDQALMALCDA